MRPGERRDQGRGKAIWVEGNAVSKILEGKANQMAERLCRRM